MGSVFTVGYNPLSILIHVSLYHPLSPSLLESSSFHPFLARLSPSLVSPFIQPLSHTPVFLHVQQQEKHKYRNNHKHTPTYLRRWTQNKRATIRQTKCPNARKTIDGSSKSSQAGALHADQQMPKSTVYRTKTRGRPGASTSIHPTNGTNTELYYNYG